MDRAFIELRPTTFGMGYVKSSLSDAKSHMLSWRQSVDREVVEKSVTGELRQMFDTLDPLTYPESKFLLTETIGDEWTAIFTNLTTGAPPSAAVSHLCRIMQCEGVSVSCVPHLDNANGEVISQGIVQFEKFSAGATHFLNYERSIEVAEEDGRWEFDASGVPLPFEELSRYSLRRIRDRFTPQMLEAYCAALRIKPFDIRFYGLTGRLIEIRSQIIQHSVPLVSVRQIFGEAVEPGTRG